MAGEIQETSKKMILRVMNSQDALQNAPEANKGKDF